MKSRANLNTDIIKEKNIYYKHGFTKDKKPVFYLITRRYSNIDPQIEMDTLLYYILKVEYYIILIIYYIIIDDSIIF